MPQGLGPGTRELEPPTLLPQIKGYETVDHPSDAQLVALARKYFVKFDRMAGLPTPTSGAATATSALPSARLPPMRWTHAFAGKSGKPEAT